MKNSLRNSLAGLAIATTTIAAPGCDQKIDATQVATEQDVKKLLRDRPLLSSNIDGHLGQIVNAIAAGTEKPTRHFLPWRAHIGTVSYFFQGNDVNPGTELLVGINEKGMHITKIAYQDSPGALSEDEGKIKLGDYLTKEYAGKVITSRLLDEINVKIGMHTIFLPSGMTVTFPNKIR